VTHSTNRRDPMTAVVRLSQAQRRLSWKTSLGSRYLPDMWRGGIGSPPSLGSPPTHRPAPASETRSSKRSNAGARDGPRTTHRSPPGVVRQRAACVAHAVNAAPENAATWHTLTSEVAVERYPLGVDQLEVNWSAIRRPVVQALSDVGRANRRRAGLTYGHTRRNAVVSQGRDACSAFE
jgi:hypothetical protein